MNRTNDNGQPCRSLICTGNKCESDSYCDHTKTEWLLEDLGPPAPGSSPYKMIRGTQSHVDWLPNFHEPPNTWWRLWSWSTDPRPWGSPHLILLKLKFGNQPKIVITRFFEWTLQSSLLEKGSTTTYCQTRGTVPDRPGMSCNWHQRPYNHSYEQLLWRLRWRTWFIQTQRHQTGIERSCYLQTTNG